MYRIQNDDHYEVFDKDYVEWLELLDEEQRHEEELTYALGKQPAQCQDCGTWIQADDLCGDGVCEDCYVPGEYDE